MGKLRLDINSTAVLEVYGIVDIVFNNVALASSKQLSATVESLEYDADILTSSNNVLKIALLNDRAIDGDSDGDYNGAEDLTLQAIVSSLSYATDGVNFITLLPHTATSYTVPSGPYVGNVIILSESVTKFVSYGAEYELVFNSDGIVTNDYLFGISGKILENGNYQNLVDGKIYDINGNEVT